MSARSAKHSAASADVQSADNDGFGSPANKNGQPNTPWLRWIVGSVIVLAIYMTGILLAGSAVLPFLVDVLLFGTVAVGLQHMVGGAGILNLGQAAFFGLGSYGGVYAIQTWGWSTVPALLFAAVVALCGGVVMLPLLRLRGIYFAMATFAFGAAVYEAFRLLTDVTGGDDGIVGIPSISLGGRPVTGDIGTWFVVVSVALVCLLAIRLLLATGYGLSLRATRQSETGASAAGIDVSRMRMMAVMIGVIPAAFAGTLYAQIHGFVSATIFSYDQSVALITMVIIGGVARPGAAFAGALIALYLTSYTLLLAGYQTLLYGLIIVVVMVAMPGGLGGVASRLLGHYRVSQYD